MQPFFRSIILLLVLFIPLQAQKNPKPFYRYKLDELKFEQIKPIESTLTPSSNYCLIQTRDGYLWIGTSSGLIRYDGIRYILFDQTNAPFLRNPLVNCLFEDNNNTLWIGTEKGIIIYRNGEFSRLNLGNSTNDSIKTKISNGSFTKIYQDKKGIYWLGAEYLFKIEDGICTQINGIERTSIRSIIEDKEGNLIIGSVSGVIFLNENRFILYDKRDGLPDNNVRSLFLDHKGYLWVATRDGGVNRLFLKPGLFSNYEKNKKSDRIFFSEENEIFNSDDGLPNNLIECFYEDLNNNLWLGSGGGGLSLYKDNKFSIYTVKDGLSNNFITTIFQDREKNLWFCTSSGELNRLKREIAKTFTMNDGLPGSMVWCILEGINNDFWIGMNDGGLCRINGKEITSFNSRNILKSNIIRSLARDHDDNIWISNVDYGLLRFKNNNFTYYPKNENLKIGMVKSVYEDLHYNIWIGNSSELLQFKNNKFLPANITDFPTTNVRVIKEDKKGTIWFARNGGLIKYKDGKSFEYNTTNGLKTNGIMSIYIDDNDVVWIATYNSGLQRLENDHFTSYSTANGLHDDWIYEILEDNNGNLWMSSNKGIFYISKSELNDFAAGKVNHITSHIIGKEEGLAVAECNGGNQPAGIKTKDGVLLFSTMNGIAIIDPEKVFSSFNSTPPSIVIEKIIVNDSVIMNLKNELEFSPGKKNFEFYFAALSYLNSSKNRCKYKLEGFDDDWKDSQPLSFVFYTNLPHGDYEFKVIGCNNDGIWNKTGASIKFRIKPFFYQTLWFNIISLLSLLSIIWFIIRMKEKRMIKKEKELRQIVDERTSDLRYSESKLRDLNSNLLEINATKDKLFSIIGHDLRGPIGTVMNYAQILNDQWHSLDQEETAELLTALKNISENTYNLLENLLYWSRNQQGTIDYHPQKYEINQLIEENINLLNYNAVKKGVSLHSEINHTIEAYFDKDMIKTVIRNLISNSIKFTKTGEVKITVESNKDHVLVSISDTGSGISDENQKKLFKTDQNFTTKGTSGEKGTGLGLILCKEFVEKNRGKIWVESTMGKGSIFKFTLPLSQ
jgi:ligand-binding sensor domain-containing protein/signal transduction histidine kinase